jgi:hypothetical protein
MRQTQRMQGIEIWNKINESAEAIAWPVVVAFGMILFRTKLGELFQRLREAATPAGTLTFDRSGESAASAKMTASAGSLVETVKAELEAASNVPDGVEGDGASATRPGVDMRELQQDVEDVITTSFQAGYLAARNLSTGGERLKRGPVPTPEIVWDGSKPRVGGYAVNGSAATEADLISLERELANTLAAQSRQLGVRDGLLKRMAHTRDRIDSSPEGPDTKRVVALHNELDRLEMETAHAEALVHEFARKAALIRKALGVGLDQL